MTLPPANFAQLTLTIDPGRLGVLLDQLLLLHDHQRQIADAVLLRDLESRSSRRCAHLRGGDASEEHRRQRPQHLRRSSLIAHVGYAAGP